MARLPLVVPALGRSLHRSLLVLIGFGVCAGVLGTLARSAPNSSEAISAEIYTPPGRWPAHPRLIATAAAWDRLFVARRDDARLDAYINSLVAQARGLLGQPPLERVLLGRRLLNTSRSFIERNLLWAFAYRVTGETVFLERAKKEMHAISNFSDWHPAHFLDVAEMTAGMALGYDWLYNELAPEDRRAFRIAIGQKGLELARHGNSTFALRNNWGQVCIGGLSLGALAIADEDPELANAVLAQAKSHAAIALEAYKPDGVYPEGPSYWIYGTTYETLLIAALRTSLGTDWGLLGQPGLVKSADFFAHVVGPTGLFFDYSDSDEKPELAPPLFFFARERNQPALLQSQDPLLNNLIKSRRPVERYAPLLALWWPATARNAAPQPLAKTFVGQGRNPVVTWRTSWSDPNSLFFAIKGGGAAINHAHMDGGSFVFDLDGVRWARDLGKQDYESLESKKIDLWNMSQKSDRWSVFRISNAAHNTLSINDDPHNASGLATLIRAGENGAAFDLTPIFLPGSASQVTRTVQIGPRSVEIKDTARGAHAGATFRWIMTTSAAIAIDGQTATLTAKDKTLRIEFSGENLKLQALDISQPRSDFDAPNPGQRQLLVTSPVAASGAWTLVTRLSGS